MRLLLSCQTPHFPNAEAARSGVHMADATRKMIRHAIIFSRGSLRVARDTQQPQTCAPIPLIYPTPSNRKNGRQGVCYLQRCMFAKTTLPPSPRARASRVLDWEVCERNTDVRYRCTRCARRPGLASSKSASLTS